MSTGRTPDNCRPAFRPRHQRPGLRSATCPTSSNRPHHKSRQGFTLVESLVALAVLGVAVGAILTPITIAIDQQRRAAKMTVATMLAEQAIEECLSQPIFSHDEWPVLGPSAGESWRDSYDEQSDYHNVTEMADQFGMVNGPEFFSEFPNLKRTMWLQMLYLPGQDSAHPPDFMMLTVRVFDGDEELVTLRRFIRNEEHEYP